MVEWKKEVRDANDGFLHEMCVGYVDFFNVCQGMIRGVVGRAKLKIAFLDRIPYLLPKLGVFEGIRERSILQFNSVPLENHDPISIEILAPDGEYRDIVDAMPRHDQMDPKLEFRIVPFRHCTMNDKVAEGPTQQ